MVAYLSDLLRAFITWEPASAPLLQVGTADIQRQRERPERRRDVPPNFCDRRLAAFLVAHQVGPGKARADIADQLRLPVPHHDRDDSARAGSDEQRPERAAARAVADRFRRLAGEWTVSEHSAVNYHS